MKQRPKTTFRPGEHVVFKPGVGPRVLAKPGGDKAVLDFVDADHCVSNGERLVIKHVRQEYVSFTNEWCELLGVVSEAHPHKTGWVMADSVRKS